MKKKAAALTFIIAFAVFGSEQTSQKVLGAGNAGQCTENDRRDYIHPGNTAFSSTWKRCGKDANGHARGTTRCLKRHFSELSQECATCFGNYVGCARDHCWTHCWRDPDGSECAECSNTHCQADLISCSGVPADQLP